MKDPMDIAREIATAHYTGTGDDPCPGEYDEARCICKLARVRAAIAAAIVKAREEAKVEASAEWLRMVNSPPLSMRGHWTSEAPTVPGYYHIRVYMCTYGDDGAPNGWEFDDADIARVEAVHGKMYAQGTHDEYHHVIGAPDFRRYEFWSSPIPEPTE